MKYFYIFGISLLLFVLTSFTAISHLFPFNTLLLGETPISQEESDKKDIPAPEANQRDREVSENVYYSEYGFLVRYPQDWHVVLEVDRRHVDYPTFGPRRLWVSFGAGKYGRHGYDGDWFVFVNDASETTVEEIVATVGNRFNDRQVKTKILLVDNTPAIHVAVTAPSFPDWLYEAIIVHNGEYIYFIHNGASENTDKNFKKFYQSLKFI